MPTPNNEFTGIVKTLIIAGLRGVVKAAPVKSLFRMDRTEKIIEMRKRIEAVNVLERSMQVLDQLKACIEQVQQKEAGMIAEKKGQIQTAEPDAFWDFGVSGWARGGREEFAKCVAEALKLLDYGKLGDSIMSDIGFRRSIPGLDDIEEQFTPKEPDPGAPAATAPSGEPRPTPDVG